MLPKKLGIEESAFDFLDFLALFLVVPTPQSGRGICFQSVVPSIFSDSRIICVNSRQNGVGFAVGFQFSQFWQLWQFWQSRRFALFA